MMEKLKLIKQGKLSAEENVRNFLEKIRKQDGKINSFLQINENALLESKEVDSKIKKGKAGRLAGLAIAVKANMNVKGMNASCASLTLKDYISPYDATVIKKIKNEDGIIIGITNCDEFACGSSGETSAFGACQNPSAPGLIPGGSSSGSAAAVSAEFCDLALGSDTGGSIRNPASHCGVVGVKPSYGLVSRYGLIDLSMSLDQIGTFAKDVRSAMLLLDVIKGKDEKDATSFSSEKIEMKKLGKLKVGLLDLEIQDRRISKLIEERVMKIAKEKSWSVEKIKLNHVDLAVQTYYPICYVEFFSGTRKFDGRRYGKKIEEVCGKEVLRRILGGSEISKAEFASLYYRRALKAKKLIKEEFENAFKKVDCIIMPTVPRLPHKLGSSIGVEEMYSYDALTIPANLAELPAISVPAGKIDNVPVGMQIYCPRFKESLMFSVAKEIED